MVNTENSDLVGCFQEGGDVKFNHGYTARLVFPCGKTDGGCTVQPSDLVGKTGRSYDTRDPEKKTTSMLTRIGLEDDMYCFYDTVVGKVCASLNEHNMFEIPGEWVTGRLEPNGEIVWSHGYTTSIIGDLCAEEASTCQVTPESWFGSIG